MEPVSIGFRQRNGGPPLGSASAKPAPPISTGAQMVDSSQTPSRPITASSQTVTLTVEGMTCGNCARQVVEALQSVPGVVSASVDPASGTASANLAEGSLPAFQLLSDAVRRSGFKAHVTGGPAASGLSTSASTADPAASPWRWVLRLGVPVTLTLMIIDWVLGWTTKSFHPWLSFLLALPVQIWVGGPFYRGAWRQLRVGHSSMDTLVALGSSAAFGFSLWGLLTGSHAHLFFMEAAAILTLVGVGHWLEGRLSRRAATTLRGLLELAPAEARLLTPTTEQLVPVSALQVGNQIVLKPGDRVPVDARVVEGLSSVDESMLTGEAVPVEKSPGGTVYAGTVNQSGHLIAEVQTTGQFTALAQIIAAVQRAQSSRAQIQRLADRISSVFVPIVVVLALATAAAWGWAFDAMTTMHQQLEPWLWSGTMLHDPASAAWMGFSAVLIVSCPCAMGLATPVALMAGLNAAARRGILIRDALALEKSGRISTVIFDKTGTLTEGKPAVVAQADFRESPSESNLLAIAGQLAGRSQHPYSGAIVKASARLEPMQTDGIPWIQWIEYGGRGIEATIEFPVRQRFRLGSPVWMSELGMDAAVVEAFGNRTECAGATLLALSLDSRIVGAFALRDPLKTGAAELVNSLRMDGLRVELLTGDNLAAATVFGASVGLRPSEIRAGVRPEGKAEAIRELQLQGERVAFVGDGLNDGPALAQADLGLAVSRATDVAREAADIVLLRADLDAIPMALQLARATLGVIRQNLFWAFFYNAAAIPLTMMGFLSPIVCAITMGLSDVIVVGNALRLGRSMRTDSPTKAG